MNESQPALLWIFVIGGGILIGWVVRKFRPQTPFLRKVLYIVVGGFLIGGVLYGFVYRDS